MTHQSPPKSTPMQHEVPFAQYNSYMHDVLMFQSKFPALLLVQPSGLRYCSSAVSALCSSPPMPDFGLVYAVISTA